MLGCFAGRPLRIVCTREFQNSIADSVHRLLADQIEALGLGTFYTVQEKRILGANGTTFVFKGLRSNITTLKSFEGADIVWVEEGQTVAKKSWEILGPTVRVRDSEIWITFNPDLFDDETYQRFVVYPPEDSIVHELNWTCNPWFPAVLDAERRHLLSRDLDAYDNVWEGKCRAHVPNALWRKEIFGPNSEPAPANPDEHARLLSRMRRIVIAVDPSGCTGEDDKRSDEIGIVAAGVGRDNIGRVLEDASGRYSPAEWAAKVISLFDKWKADKIVAERNFGGATVELLIRAVRRTAPVKLVNASRGKQQRAEPVAALYERGEVRHVGRFPELERQYCLFSTAGYMGPRSPDHADAAIWGLTELMLDSEPVPGVRFFTL